jgi:hypothetical protein
MSYVELSDRLRLLSETLRQQGEKLEGTALAKATGTFTRSLGSFEKKLHDFLGGQGPGLRELQDLLKAPQAKKHLSLPALKIVFRELLAKPLREETPAKAKAALLQEIKEQQKGEKAVAYLKEFFFRAAASAPVGEDKEALQKEFLRLGSLGDEELAYELEHRFKTIGALKKLAKANAVTFTAKTPKARLIESIVHYAQRAHRNVGA